MKEEIDKDLLEKIEQIDLDEVDDEEIGCGRWDIFLGWCGKHT